MAAVLEAGVDWSVVTLVVCSSFATSVLKAAISRSSVKCAILVVGLYKKYGRPDE
jgi:hypothetical protein